MKRIHLALAAIAVSAMTAGAQVSWNLNVGSQGANLNVGTPGYYYVGAPMLAMPAPGYYYYDHGKGYKKHMKKARKYAKKAAKEYRKAGYYGRAAHGAFMPPPPPKNKKHKHH